MQRPHKLRQAQSSYDSYGWAHGIDEEDGARVLVCVPGYTYLNARMFMSVSEQVTWQVSLDACTVLAADYGARRKHNSYCSTDENNDLCESCHAQLEQTCNIFAASRRQLTIRFTLFRHYFCAKSLHSPTIYDSLNDTTSTKSILNDCREKLERTRSEHRTPTSSRRVFSTGFGTSSVPCRSPTLDPTVNYNVPDKDK
ncbi:hypothetical protein CBL_02066 [Carabus blaptoides fortunei]